MIATSINLWNLYHLLIDTLSQFCSKLTKADGDKDLDPGDDVDDGKADDDSNHETGNDINDGEADEEEEV